MPFLNELFDAFEADRLAEIAQDEARRNTPEALAAAQRKRAEEHERGVRLGWWDEDGTPIVEPEDDPDEDDEEA